ncbi:ArnT family glycosyltransferase [Nonomuraea rhizosphaerae]|uniref:ArnT family glycosyltransferase n=1 Tax=Nonomuraea rhizosphaerae TaxID=2665663 RepID=UPI001C5CDADE|nr:glycosyltransferase family 39 protein [Nonomuraea rhizosphaerae]
MTALLDRAPHRRARIPGGAPRWSRPAFWGVLVVAGVLYTWALSGDGNEYYSAAILSGTQSWKAFFFGALDAGSYITVDKPPLALWVMGLSARIFGFSTWSMLIPQALAGVASVALVHSAVRRAYPVVSARSLSGSSSSAHSEVRQAHVAALAAAVIMTLTPITVAINRINNPDTILVLLLVLAAWFCLESLRTGRLRSLLLSAVFVGLAFNAKMLQAYLVVPAFALAYLLCARHGLLKRVGHLLAAGGVMAVSSAWWMVIVDLLPASSRPYIGGSTDNSVRDLVIGYNGLGRVFGQGGRGGGGASFGGAAGADRLFNDTMAGQISWLLPFCALALIFALGMRWRRTSPGSAGSTAAWLVWGGWLVVHFVVFSFSSGTFHPYYTTAMAPAVAVVTAMGGVAMWQAYRSSAAWSWVLPLGIAVTGAWSFTVLRRTPDFVPWLAWLVLAATVLATGGLLLARLRRDVTVKVAAAALVATAVVALAGPAAYAVTPLRSPSNGTNPTAGPSGGGFGGPGGGFRGMRQGDQPPFGGQPSTGQNGQPQPTQGEERRSGRTGGGFGGGGLSTSTLSYLEANQGDAEWLVAVNSAMQASSAILSTGKPVIAMGGFTGSDPAMTVDKLKAYVSSGRLRYVMSGGDRGGPGRGNSEVTTWVTANCTEVSGQDGLYDCAS